MQNIVQVILSARDDGKLASIVNRTERSIVGFGNKTVATFRRANEALQGFSRDYLRGLDSIGIGLGGGFALKGVIEFDARLARLAIQAGLSRKEMFDLKDQLFQVGEATHQTPGELLSGIEQIVEKTGNFKFAVDSLKDMGIVASATGSQMEYIGATASNLQEKMGITKDEVLQVFDILNAQGKQGSFTLQNMAAMFERLLSSAARFDVQGVKGMRSFGAFLQIARRGAGNSEQATTAVERTVSDLIQNAGKIQKETGFSIFDADKTKKAGRAVMKDFDVVLKEVIKRTKGDVTILQKIFGEESVRAITPLSQSFQKFGDFREFDAFIAMGGDGAMTMKDFAFWSEQTTTKISDLRTQLSKFVNENLAKPIELLTSALDKLNQHPAITKGALWGGVGLMGAMVGGKLINMGKNTLGLGKDIFNIWRGKAPGGGGITGGGLPGLGGGGGPIPVYIVNKHLSMLPGQGWGMPGGSPTEGLPAPAGGGKTGSFIKNAGYVGIAAGAGYAVGTGINSLIDKLAKATTGEDKGLGGAIYDWLHKDAAIKNESNLKGKTNRVLSEKVEKVIQTEKVIEGSGRDREKAGEIKNYMNIQIDKDGRVFQEGNMKTEIKVNRGAHK